MTTDPYLTSSAAAGTPTVRRISWGAALAGVVIALAVHLLLSLLGMAIGLAVVDPADPGGFGIGAAIWWVICSLVSVFIGAWVAARLAGVPNPTDGMLHGLLVWSAATLLSVYLLTSAVGSLASGAMSVVSGTASVVSTVAPAAAPVAREMIGGLGGGQGASVSEVLNEIESSLTGPNAAQARRELRQLFTEAREEDLTSPQFRQRVVQFLTERGEMQQARAEQLTDRAIRGYQQLRQQLGQLGDQAADTAENAADAVAKAALWSFLAVLFGALAGAFGGRKGSPTLDVTHGRPAATTPPPRTRP